MLPTVGTSIIDRDLQNITETNGASAPEQMMEHPLVLVCFESFHMSTWSAIRRVVEVIRV